MVVLAVDIGNTSTAFGAFNADSLNHRFHFPTRTLTHRALTQESLAQPLSEIERPDLIGIASVVPWASDELIVVLHEIFPEATIMVVTSATIPLSIDYPNPDELGTDRLLGALAAYKHWGEREARPAIVIDLGTATTFDCITADGHYLGGAIAPGLELAAEALAERAVQLPLVELVFPSSVIGRTTIESIQSGVLYGGVAQVEGMIHRLTQAVFTSVKPIVVVTGGLSRLLDGHTSMIEHFAPDLILEGIRIASELMTQSQQELTSVYHS